MKSIHEVIFNMMLEIDEICKKYDITYYTAGGTVIGAARHDGFIPWDDDADLYMTRDEFARFREAFYIEKPENRVLECKEDNPDYPGSIPRYIDITTSYIARFDVLNNCAAGVVVDIFLLDPVPDDPELIRKHRNLLNVYSDFIMPFYGYSYRNDDDYLNTYLEYCEKAEKEGKQAVIAELEEILFTYPEEEASYYMLRWGTLPHLFPKDMMGEPLYLKFEGHDFPVPHRWYDYLVMLYGPDWYLVPEFIADEGHLAVIDYDKPYTVYMNDASKYIDNDLLEEALYFRKKALVNRAILNRDYILEQVGVNKKYILYKLNEKIKGLEKPLDELFEDGEYQQILDAFFDYDRAQFATAYIGQPKHVYMYRRYNPVLIPLTIRQYYFYIYTCLISGKYDRVISLERILPSDVKEESSIKELFDLAQKVFDIIKANNIKDFRRAGQLISEIDNDAYERIGLIKVIDYSIQLKKDEQHLDVEELMALPENISDETKKLAAEMYEMRGDKEKAESLYREIYQTTRNGLILNEIKDKVPSDTIPSYEVEKETEEQDVKTDEGRTIMELLKEMDRICSENGLNYSLLGRTLMHAEKYGRLASESRSPVLTMPPEDALKFIEKVQETDGNYTIRYQKNYEDHNSHTIHFSDKRTTYINLNTKQFNNIHLTIRIPKRRNRSYAKSVKTRMMEVFEFANATELKTERKFIKMIRKSADKYIGWKGKKQFKEELFDREMDDAINGKGEYYYSYARIRQQARFYLPVKLFDEYKTVYIYGTPLKAFKDTETYYLRAFYKYILDDVTIRPDIFRMRIINDSSVDLETMKSVLDINIWETEAWKNYQKSLRNTDKVRKAGKLNKTAFRKVERTQTRIELAEEYLPMKQEILSLYNGGDYDERTLEELQKILYNYDVKARYYARGKYAINFDRDLTEVYLNILAREGEEDLSERIRRNIAEENLEPLDDETINYLLKNKNSID